MHGILKTLQLSGEFLNLLKGWEKNCKRQLVTGLSGSLRSCLFAALAEKTAPQPTLVITPGEREAGQLIDEISGMLPGFGVKQFPVWQMLPCHVLAESNEVVAQRLQVLESLVKGEHLIVVAPVEALLRRLIPPADFGAAFLKLAVGCRADLDILLHRLAELRYERTNLVEGRGRFSLRGGILDIFPMTSYRPARIEFFDDEIESIRLFSAATQRSEEKINELTIYPAREFIIARPVWEEARQALEKEYRARLRKLSSLPDGRAARQLSEKYGELAETMKGYFDGIEQFMPFFFKETVTLMDYFPRPAAVLVDDPARVKEVVDLIQRERTEVYMELLGDGKFLPSQFLGYADWSNIENSLAERRCVYFSLLPRRPQFVKPENIVNFIGKSMPSFLGNLKLLAEEINTWRRAGRAVVILAAGYQSAQHLLGFLRENNIDAFYAGNLEGHVKSGNVVISVGNLYSGFELPGCRVVVITEQDIYSQRKKLKKLKRKQSRQAERLAPFVDLKAGDYVVHFNHGIGRYLGVVPLTIGGIKKEYLLVQYAGEDKLYVPVDQVGFIQKYLGGEGDAPRLSRLGGGEWARVKGRVKEAVRDMARELLSLYAARETIKGYSFGPDTVWQKEFEETFPYEETPDQLRAVEEVKADMERKRPMDRLLCGDVGYGKTEVALRAGFKAVADGKQVAVLVPTTILAQQHYHTFQERLAGYPVNVEVLSRFRTAREQRQVIEGLKRGTVDIVIGTHRLIQDDVRFKELGLLVVDEEQRFGVTHKEKIKLMRKDVDVLTLTATPIPRTLHMSLVGVRDTSILETPPEDRYPVQTYVLEEDPVLIREAIRRELNRGGQVFFVYNRIIDLDRIARWLQELVPEARIAVAHGQVREEELEQVMLDFIDREYDLLVCTTIIENGLDISNVNTLIVKESNMMGLAQLYQLRGRVGRSNRLAYAYFTYRRDRVLGEAAEKRLAAIREFTELGSGFKIAMRDLEIRGAGNILGTEQHGHIAAVGFDLYCRLLEEAVREAKGADVAPAVETTIELPVEAYIPGTYVPDMNQKVEIYKRLAGLTSLGELKDLGEEMADRFGDPPEPVLNLIAVAKVRVLASRLRIKNVSLLPGQFRLLFGPAHPLTGESLVEVSRHYHNRVKFINTGEDFEIKLRIAGSGHAESRFLLLQLEDFLNTLAKNCPGVEFLPGESPDVATGSRINI